MTIVSVTIVRTEEIELPSRHVAYVLRVCTDDLGEWEIFRRFSWFVDLDKKLRILFGTRFSHYVPSLPSRFGWGDRVVRLNAYLSALKTLPAEITACELFCEFLRIPVSTRIDDTLTPELPTTPPQSPPMVEDEFSILEQVSTMASTNGGIVKLAWTESLIKKALQKVLMPAIGNWIDRVRAVGALRATLRYMSVEYNFEYAQVFVHVGKQLEGWGECLGVHVPQTSDNQRDVFLLVDRLGGANFLEDPSLYLAWRFQLSLEPRPVGESSSPKSAEFLGPQSPMARSVLNNYASNVSKSQLVNEAKECVEFSLAAGRERFFIPGSEKGTDLFRQVATPPETQLPPGTSVAMSYRPVTFGDIEIRIECEFSCACTCGCTCVFNALSLLWSGESDSYFGLGSGESIGTCVLCTFADPRRFKGKTVLSLLKSIHRGMDMSYIISACADQAHTSSSEKRIQHLHFIGAEVREGAITIVGLLSSESIFLVAGDLLGEGLLLWRAIERFFAQLPNACGGELVAELAENVTP